MRQLKILIFVASIFFCVTSFASDPAPLAMLKKTADQMTVELDKHVGHLKNNDKLVYDLVDRILVPHFDIVSMSQAVIGRNYWGPASNAVRQQFMNEFTKYVIRTYSSALQSYDGEKIKFLPMRGNVANRVQINSELLLKNGPPLQIQYRLLCKNGNWLIYDFSVDGISIVKNYNSQFAGVLRQGGLTMLVKQLQNKNAKR